MRSDHSLFKLIVPKSPRRCQKERSFVQIPPLKLWRSVFTFRDTGDRTANRIGICLRHSAPLPIQAKFYIKGENTVKIQWVFLLATCLCLPAAAEIVTYQGKLESSGEPHTGTVEMIFELHESETGDTEVASHGPVQVEVTDGLFQEDLEFGSGVFDGSSRYLQIIVEESPLDDRHPIRPSPMALYAFDGDGDGGGDSGDSHWTLTGNDIHYDDGYVGIGNDQPDTPLHVHGSIISGSDDNVASGLHSFVSGGSVEDLDFPNVASGIHAFIGGGAANEVSGGSAAIAGGDFNEASGDWSFIGGGASNEAAGTASSAFGYRAKALHDGTYVWSDNSVDEDFKSTGEDQYLILATGGVGINTNSPQETLDVAGRLRVADFASETADHVCRTPEGTLANCSGEPGNGSDAWLLGGNAGTDPETDYIGTSDETPLELRVDGQRRFRIEPGEVSPNLIAGHAGNTVESEESGATIGGGGSHNNPNSTQGRSPVVGGGEGNEAWGNWTTVSGGLLNSAGGVQATVGGGTQNEAGGFHPTVAGGQHNTAIHHGASVGGGKQNLVDQEAGTVSGGENNTVSGDYGTVGGGENNTADADHAIVAGGGLNTASGSRSTVGGGWNNLTDDAAATVAGGVGNTADGDAATVGGGLSNTASGTDATVAGGFSNTAGAFGATVGGGANNLAEGSRSTVSGGNDNTADGNWATIPGGEGNVASGSYSFAAGRNAVAGEIGSFVWADSLDHELDFVGENEFMARATGGVVFVTGVNDSGNPTSGASLADGGSSWQSISDRNAKTAVTPVDPAVVLEGLVQMPISEYSYKTQDESIRHMGPMAQDFHPLFGLGEDELRVSAMNLVGIALAAIQGLNTELETSTARMAALETENSELAERVAAVEAENAELRQLAERNTELEDRLAALEALLREDRQVAEQSQ